MKTYEINLWDIESYEKIEELRPLVEGDVLIKVHRREGERVRHVTEIITVIHIDQTKNDMIRFDRHLNPFFDHSDPSASARDGIGNQYESNIKKWSNTHLVKLK